MTKTMLSTEEREIAYLRHYLQKTAEALQAAMDAAPVLGSWQAMYHVNVIKKKPPAKKGGLNRTKELEEKINVKIMKYAALVKALEEAQKVLAKGNNYEKSKSPKRYYFPVPHFPVDGFDDYLHGKDAEHSHKL